ncbi:hypothetical protein [Tessaracoccus oleiagri]|uniref:Uncharacterized protein n=1 Tax=Tessaracoccus oleiagri TaxID=686624 RepID=A0A1G9K1G1_9ACTN|nr:hypothetical protein [Tessaracoccus oleiagri]SDL43609.1 hypothetical protein SAMN04488242_1590 [Tessaracoccus oleiagri]
MPTNTALRLDRTYMEEAHVPVRRESALRAIHHLLDLENVDLAHKKELISIGLWKWTEAEGFPPHPKYHIRLRSVGSIDVERTAKVNHEHVWTRSWITGELLRRESWTLDDLRNFLTQYAVACIVTTDEHARLSQSRATGWERYREAGVLVWDMLTDLPFELPIGADTSSKDEQATARRGSSEPAFLVDEAVAQQGGAQASNLRRLLARLGTEEIAVVVGETREGGVGDYLRVHDFSTGEPSPAVAYLHWNGKVSVRLQHTELPDYLASDPDVRSVQHRSYGVNTRLTGHESLDLAEELVTLALDKVRSL